MKKLFLLLSLILFASILSFSQTPSKKLIKIMNNANAAPNGSSDVIIDCTPITLNGCNYITNSNFTPDSHYDIFNNWNHYIDPFTLGLIPSWYPAQNTPQLTDGNLDNTTGPPYTWIDPPSAPPSPATYYEHGTSTHFGNGLTIVEGVAQKIPALTPGKKYLFSFFNKIKDYIGGSWLDTYNVYLMHCSDNNVFSNPAIPIPVHSQPIVCQTNLTHQNWQRYLTTFTATEDFDMIWIFPKQNTVQPPFDFAFVGAEIAYPELIDVNNFSAGNPPNPTPGNCTVTIGPTIPNCGVANAVFTWTGPPPNNQTIIAPANQQIQIDASNPLNVGTWTLTMTVPNALTPNGICSQAANVSATVNVPPCCNHPIVTPGGPIDYYYFWEQGGYIGVTLTSNTSTGNQWYKNGVQIANANQQTFIAHEAGTYTVTNNSCPSNPVVVNTYPYGSNSPITWGEQVMPVQSSGYYCVNTTEAIKQFDLGSNANYTWNTNPFSLPSPALQIDPLSYNIHSPNAQVNVGSFYATPFVQATADLNGVQKVLDYHITVWPLNTQPYQLCRNITYHFYSAYNNIPYTLPGGTKFDFESYDFGPNGVIVAPSIYAGLHQITISGNSPLSGPIDVQFSNGSYVKRHFIYNWGGCYEDFANVQIVCGKSANKIDVNIYPNPATNQITITSSETINSIEISDLMNPALKSIKVNSAKSTTINVSDLKPGVYNCKITTTKGIEYQKLLINR